MGAFELAANGLGHAFEIAVYVAVPKSYDTIAMSSDLGSPQFIRAGIIHVLTAVELNRELSRGTREVGDAPADWMLPPEFPRREFLPKCVPQPSLDIGRIAAKPSRPNGPRSYPHPAPPLPGPLRPIGAEREAPQRTGIPYKMPPLFHSALMPRASFRGESLPTLRSNDSP